MRDGDLSHEKDILSERGQFWLAGDLEQMSDATATRATLTISARTINLELDKDEWKWGEPSDSFADIHSRKFAIVGRLADSGKYVRLERAFARKAHPFGPGGNVVVTAIGTFICMVSDRTSDDARAKSLVSAIRLPLGSLRAWLNLPMPKHGTAENGFHVHYADEPDIEFSLAPGRLVISSGSTANVDFKERTLTVTQHASMEFSLNAGISFEKAAELYFDIEDLLVLLTDHEVALDWPSVGFSGLNSTCTLYCTSRPRSASKFSAIECWLLFSQIRENFGAVIDRWLGLRDEVGPAFHLYLGTRRGVDLYEEHRFVNLIWGLEALHRHTSGEGISERAAAKIKRILASIDENLSAKDRKWLTKLLDNAMAPSLADRLNSLFTELPLRISPEEVYKFAKKCADHRNDISHHGGPSRVGYNAFVLELHKLAGALTHIYHAGILLRLGITGEQIEHIFFDSFCSGVIRSQLQDAGLRPEATPRRS